MKYINFLLLFLLLSVFSCAYAQENTDSVYFFKQSSAENIFIKDNITFLSGSKIQKSGFANLSYQYTGGHFRKAQEAEKDQQISIYTEGINTIGRFKVAGSFSFSRAYQDSLAWSSKGTEIDAQTFYFGSQKAGKFEHLDYKLNGILSYSLIKDKLHIGMGADYDYRSSTRSVDPRPKVDHFKLAFKPEIVYQMGSHFIGLQGILGYGIEDFGLTYKTKAFENGTYYKDRVNYLIFGYGAIREAAEDQKTVRNEGYNGLTLSYSGNLNNYKLITKLSYNYIEERFKDVVTTSVNDVLIGTYWLEKLQAEMLFRKSDDKVIQQFSGRLSSTSGHDKNESYGATNYRYERFTADAEYSVRWNLDKKISPEFGVNLVSDRIRRKVLITAHDISNGTIQTGLFGALYLKLPRKDLISFDMNFSYIMPQNNKLSIPQLQENYFTRGVIYGDYMYYTSKAIALKNRVNYISNNLFKEFKTGISISTNYLKQTSSEFSFENSIFTPDKYRLITNLSLNLYF